MAVRAEMLPPMDKATATGRGGKRARARREATHNAAFATYVHYDEPEPTVDPRALAHTPGSAHYGPPAFDNTIKAFDLAHRLGVEPSCETIRTLDRIVSTASASHDQPEPGPSSLGKRPRLEERLTTVATFQSCSDYRCQRFSREGARST